MVKETVTVTRDVYDMVVDIIKEHTALMNEVHRHDYIMRFYKEKCSGEDVVRCELINIEDLKWRLIDDRG